ncbi:MAG: polysaccharide biosynthesis/export family protein, partial [Pyrinomonadaceae bacterium]
MLKSLCRSAGAFAVVVMVCLSAAAQQTTAKPDNTGTSGATIPSATAVGNNDRSNNRYRIGPGDELEISILNRTHLSREADRDEGNGMIRMPLIEAEIRAACQTEGELAKEIATRYLKFYRNPQVDVFIKGYHSRQVAIIGAVND